ncbi:hypothetical protein [Tritonibacter horizontis]|uniref:Uncharacterized protein n=1 Tax=Tritonibacter horizontis TaxID=1768241 RepID=A0A132BTS4_9RHOB|nr:hypothetical protein [Tritonibacter horizontis]KUP91795.1 hypothetical protein TRIHO_33260 [Tritonibacter horizontis]
MKIKMTTSCSGPFGSFVVGEIRTVPDALGADLVRAQYADVMDADAQLPLAASAPQAPKPAAKGK